MASLPLWAGWADCLRSLIPLKYGDRPGAALGYLSETFKLAAYLVNLIAEKKKVRRGKRMGFHPQVGVICVHRL